MSASDPRMERLLRRWEECQRRGESITAEELCRDSPELLDDVRKWIAAPTANDRVSDTSQSHHTLQPPQPEATPTSAPRSDDLHPGAEPVAGYVLAHKLGSGGYGEVWKAVAPGGFSVAMKFVQLADSGLALEQRGLEIIKSLRHPNLITTFGSWQTARHLVVAMELADRTLWGRYEEAVAEGHSGIPRDELWEYMTEAAKGLDYLNEPRHFLSGTERMGVQHRDIKPQNILLVGNGVKVADFGLVRLLEHTVTSHTGSLTPAYAAPEFFEGHTSNHSDQYSLAITYCHLRSGQVPFRGNLAQIMNGHLTHAPDLSMLPAEEQPVVARALAKNPAQRWPSCLAFVHALRASVMSARPVSPRRFSPRAAALSAISLATLIAVIAQFPAWKQYFIKSNVDDGNPTVLQTTKELIQPTTSESAKAVKSVANNATSNVGRLIETSPVALTEPKSVVPSGEPKSGPPKMIEKPVAEVANSSKFDPLLTSAKNSTDDRPKPAALNVAAKPADNVADKLKVEPIPLPKKNESAADPIPELTNSIDMVFKLIPAGEFEMGSSAADVAGLVRDFPDFKKESADDEQPRHPVRITQPYFLGKFEVTKGQFAKFVADEDFKTEAERDGEGAWGYDADGKKFEGRNSKYSWRNTGWSPYGDDHPVVNVSWHDAQAFCAWLSHKESKSYRLPTEAEWEYACRARTTTRHPGGNDISDLAEIANIADQSTKRIPGITQNDFFAPFDDGYPFTAPVGSLAANAFGLHDMIGNVSEWCEDTYDAKLYGRRSGMTSDPWQSSGSEYRVLRGGSWYYFPSFARSADRSSFTPGSRLGSTGFRVVCASVANPR